MIEDVKVFCTLLDNTPDDIYEELRSEFNYIARLFLFCRPSVHLLNLKGLNFSFIIGNEGPTTVKESIYPEKKFTTGLCIIRYSAEHHQKLSKEERYLNILNLMQEGIKPYASHLGISLSYFENTFTRMRAMGFKGCSFILDPVKSSRNRKYKASMEVEFEENKNSFNIVFLDKSNQIIR